MNGEIFSNFFSLVQGRSNFKQKIKFFTSPLLSLVCSSEAYKTVSTPGRAVMQGSDDIQLGLEIVISLNGHGTESSDIISDD